MYVYLFVSNRNHPLWYALIKSSSQQKKIIIIFNINIRPCDGRALSIGLELIEKALK